MPWSYACGEQCELHIVDYMPPCVTEQGNCDLQGSTGSLHYQGSMCTRDAQSIDWQAMTLDEFTMYLQGILKEIGMKRSSEWCSYLCTIYTL